MDKVIEFLNKALSIEYSAVIQYCQHSALVQGIDRAVYEEFFNCLLYTSPSPRDVEESRMPSSA